MVPGIGPNQYEPKLLPLMARNSRLAPTVEPETPTTFNVFVAELEITVAWPGVRKEVVNLVSLLILEKGPNRLGLRPMARAGESR